MFRNFFKPNYPRKAIGFGSDTITAIALNRTGKYRYALNNAASTTVSRKLLRPSFDDPNITDTHELASVLDDLVLEAGLGAGKKWSVSLPTATARTAIITLDEKPASKSETESILDWKTETAFGAPASDLRLSRFRISPSADGKIRYFASALRLDVLEDYELVFSELGWAIGVIVPRVLAESNWLSSLTGDSLLITTQSDGLTALLIRDQEPVVVRSVSCDEGELDDEVYRLLVYYQDRLVNNGDRGLSRLMVIGNSIDAARMDEITSEAMGEALALTGPDDVGFEIPSSDLQFSDLAAPAGLALLGWK